MLYILVIFQTLIFICCCIFSIYLLILLIWSRGFTISPTVSSNKKSIKKIAEFLSNYIEENSLKKVRILDIGSGYGKMLFGIEKELSKNKNLSQELVGYEISKIPCNISKKLKEKYSQDLIISTVSHVHLTNLLAAFSLPCSASQRVVKTKRSQKKANSTLNLSV